MGEKRFSVRNSIIMLAVFLIITLFAVFKLDQFWKGQESRNPEEVRKAILSASVQCYALEGSYPPSLEYLQKHYGIVIDKDKYFYYYEVFASNVMPDVEVYER